MSDATATDTPAADEVPVDDVATDTPTAPVATAEPDEATEGRELIELVGSGWVRMWIGGRRYRLRRPFFGELRELRLLVESMSDEISTRSFEVQQIGREITAQADEIDKNQDLDATERAAQVRALRARSAVVSRDLTNAADDLRLGWWTRVFGTLAVDGTPEDFPGWIVDYTLPDQILQHWRSAPLARG